MPLLPLRDVVVYPYMVIPLFVGRASSTRALDEAMKNPNKEIFLTAQKEASKDNPKEKDLFQTGTIATVLQLLKLPDGTIKVLVEGLHRGTINQVHMDKQFMTVDVERVAEEDISKKNEKQKKELEVLTRTLKSQFEQYVKMNKRIPPEILTPLETIEDPARLVDSIAAHLVVPLNKKQELLEALQVKKRLEKLIEVLESEVDMIQIEKRVKGRVKRQMEKSQREYYLNEQMKAIQSELGEGADGVNEIEELTNKIKKSGMPKEAFEKSMSELGKLKMMPAMSAEATVSRNYLDWMLDVPWKKETKLKHSLKAAEETLEREHYGLHKVKERILEYLAVQQRVKKIKGPILCLVGPPGVGKTSLGQSIANATGRKMVRMSLGGVRDEAEIRGHRRTYIGSMPGKIIQKIVKAEARNPFFLLDEIDKMAADFRGDPAAALLEVLDPEQNATFNDHYLEVDYDLSDVMFVATANTLNIPPALQDRMEVIRISGYTEDEKVNIAIRHLIPKQLENAGLKKGELTIKEEAVVDIIRYYTREAGVRNLEREIAKLCRKVVKNILLSSKKAKSRFTIHSDNLSDYLGVKRFRYGIAEEYDRIGQVTGLAWTQVGGELLQIEAATMHGKGNTKYTGSLGNVMQESIQAAMTVVRSRMELLNIDKDFFQKNDIHIHVPEGATPKDGPSAGVSMCTAIVSVITGLPVRADVAMTGEITLRGEVLAIGGLKEKLLAAHRANVRCVIIPEENRKDLQEIPENVKKDLVIKPVKWIDEVFSITLVGYVDLLTSKTDDVQKRPKNAKTKSSKTMKVTARKSRSRQRSTRTH
ncbi:MAG: endopeptidase La [Gammaproteobacteria bacterium]